MKEPKQLIVQFKIDGNGSSEDLDLIVQIEEELDTLFREGHVAVVDGHDIGSGEMNVFVQVARWKPCVEGLLAHMEEATWAGRATAAGRRADGTYEVIWPKHFTDEFSIK